MVMAMIGSVFSATKDVFWLLTMSVSGAAVVLVVMHVAAFTSNFLGPKQA